MYRGDENTNPESTLGTAGGLTENKSSDYAKWSRSIEPIVKNIETNLTDASTGVHKRKLFSSYANPSRYDFPSSKFREIRKDNFVREESFCDCESSKDSIGHDPRSHQRQRNGGAGRDHHHHHPGEPELNEQMKHILGLFAEKQRQYEDGTSKRYTDLQQLIYAVQTRLNTLNANVAKVTETESFEKNQEKFGILDGSITDLKFKLDRIEDLVNQTSRVGDRNQMYIETLQKSSQDSYSKVQQLVENKVALIEQTEQFIRDSLDMEVGKMKQEWTNVRAMILKTKAELKNDIQKVSTTVDTDDLITRNDVEVIMTNLEDGLRTKFLDMIAGNLESLENLEKIQDQKREQHGLKVEGDIKAELELFKSVMNDKLSDIEHNWSSQLELGIVDGLRVNHRTLADDFAKEKTLTARRFESIKSEFSNFDLQVDQAKRDIITDFEKMLTRLDAQFEQKLEVERSECKRLQDRIKLVEARFLNFEEGNIESKKRMEFYEQRLLKLEEKHGEVVENSQEEITKAKHLFERQLIEHMERESAKLREREAKEEEERKIQSGLIEQERELYRETHDKLIKQLGLQQQLEEQNKELQKMLADEKSERQEMMSSLANEIEEERKKAQEFRREVEARKMESKEENKAQAEEEEIEEQIGGQDLDSDSNHEEEETVAESLTPRPLRSSYIGGTSTNNSVEGSRVFEEEMMPVDYYGSPAFSGTNLASARSFMNSSRRLGTSEMRYSSHRASFEKRSHEGSPERTGTEDSPLSKSHDFIMGMGRSSVNSKAESEEQDNMVSPRRTISRMTYQSIQEVDNQKESTATSVFKKTGGGKSHIGSAGSPSDLQESHASVGRTDVTFSQSPEHRLEHSSFENSKMTTPSLKNLETVVSNDHFKPSQIQEETKEFEDTGPVASVGKRASPVGLKVTQETGDQGHRVDSLGNDKSLNEINMLSPGLPEVDRDQNRMTLIKSSPQESENRESVNDPWSRFEVESADFERDEEVKFGSGKVELVRDSTENRQTVIKKDGEDELGDLPDRDNLDDEDGDDFNKVTRISNFSQSGTHEQHYLNLSDEYKDDFFDDPKSSARSSRTRGSATRTSAEGAITAMEKKKVIEEKKDEVDDIEDEYYDDDDFYNVENESFDKNAVTAGSDVAFDDDDDDDLYAFVGHDNTKKK